MAQAADVLNIAGYRFVNLEDRDELREPFRQACARFSLKGTILLSTEGINIFVAGSKTQIADFLSWLEQDERFKDIQFKESYSDSQPFTRMNVRLKKEIISVGQPEFARIDGAEGRIEPEELRQRLDKGEDIVLLDTRNIYETRVGTFDNALELNIDSFREFPQAIQSIENKDAEYVMFCTGGVRCEKASVIMRDAGFSNVRQLEGGILGYFEKVGGEYWNGDCFVFDKRVALDPKLNETTVEICYACREPLSVEEQSSKGYVIGRSCPYCIEGKQ